MMSNLVDSCGEMGLDEYWIDQDDLSALRGWDIHSEILAVDSTEGKEKIIRLAKNKISCWQIFLQYLGLGSLAHKEIGLLQVNQYLNKYNWSLKSPDDPIYLNVCRLANKALFKGDLTLYKNVCGEFAIEKTINAKVFVDEKNISKLHTYYSLNIGWNPCLQVKHIEAFIRFQCDKIFSFNIKNYRGGAILEGNILSKEDVQNLQISIIQKFKMHRPSPHYIYIHHFPPRR
jgi:hypothetical protein